MMRNNIAMQTTAADKPENTDDTKIQDNEHDTVDPHVEFIIKGALIALVALTFLTFTWKGISSNRVDTAKDYIEIESVEGGWEE